MSSLNIGIVHPGEMGAGIGAALVEAGHQVFWASLGRSAATRARAELIGLRDAGSIAALSKEVSVIISVCPPHAALDVAREAAGFSGIYLDANAIAPTTAAEVAYVIESAGGHYLDGGIIGLPPSPGHPARLYLSGPGADVLAARLESPGIDLRVLSDRQGDASALKAAYAAWTKGTSALVVAIQAMARNLGVEAALLAEWQESQPDIAKRSLNAAGQAATKGWRWVGEMEEIAKAMRGAGLPGGFHEAAAEIYQRSPRDERAKRDQQTLELVLDALRNS